MLSVSADEVTTLSNETSGVAVPRAIPFNGLPLLPPPVELETKRTLKKAISANKALAELRTAGDLIPNQAVLSR